MRRIVFSLLLIWVCIIWSPQAKGGPLNPSSIQDLVWGKKYGCGDHGGSVSDFKERCEFLLILPSPHLWEEGKRVVWRYDAGWRDPWGPHNPSDTWCERGVAYDPIEDALYVSNWFSSVIYKLDPDNRCVQLGHCDLNYLGYPYCSIAGLVYDGDYDVIWMVTNSEPNYLFAIYAFADGYYRNGTVANGFYNGPVPW